MGHASKSRPGADANTSLRHTLIYPEQSAGRRYWWLIVAPAAEVDLCAVDPGFDVDLYVTTDLRTMTAIWMGLMSVRQAITESKLTLTGIANWQPTSRNG